MKNPLFTELVANDILEAYDQVESVLNGIDTLGPMRNPDIVHHLTAARDHLFQARVLTDDERVGVKR